ncbi:TetR/AcrR family transcriptional regulator [Neorhizobium sp. T786]|uniref:TetR/AcrR family transcriptional regulator n=1 Tax=Pseudorhizobium xiangyangii TaxID=2883104 RepID=UPI001CFFBF7C|nr:TetR/AcrR family transcriptional regulator [Neorhizobium xiangyangii]MCB5201853.1 TetR/AcrR family transcriptional regulator [Neorhizobium xiangyangii]
MGRTRKITTDDILDAAERVVTRLGAAGLSIDAVAQEAGVSKSRVVYDHKSKSALLEALIDRTLSEEFKRVKQSVEAHTHAPHPELFGRITLAEQAPDDIDRAVALAISAAMSTEEKVQRQMREWTATDLKAMSGGKHPKAALMAYLALTGFYCTELFSFHRWDAEQRTEILEGIRTIYATYPDNAQFVPQDDTPRV